MNKHWSAIRLAYESFDAHDCFLLSGGIAFFAMLSLAPMLVVALGVASIVFGDEALNGVLHRQLEPFLGEEPAAFVTELVQRAGSPQEGTVAALVGTLVIFYAATRVFVELQNALRRVWEIGANSDPRLRVRAFDFFYRRAIAFLLVMLLGVLLAGLLVAEGALQWLAGEIYGLPAPGLVHLVDLVLGLVALTLLIAAIYRALTDGAVLWGNALRGAVLTSLLMGVGGGLFATYVRVGFSYSVYGAAGSFAALMLGSYYGAIIFLFGAELARAYKLLLRS